MFCLLYIDFIEDALPDAEQMRGISRHSTGGSKCGNYLFLPPYNDFLSIEKPKPFTN